MNYILLNDDDDDELPNRSGLRKRAAGMMMEVEADLKKTMVMTQLLLS